MPYRGNGSAGSRTVPATEIDRRMPWRRQHDPQADILIAADDYLEQAQVGLHRLGPFRTLEHICSGCRDDRHPCYEVSMAKDEDDLITAVVFGWDKLEEQSTSPSWQYIKMMDQALCFRKDGATRLSMIVHRWLSKVAMLQDLVESCRLTSKPVFQTFERQAEILRRRYTPMDAATVRMRYTVLDFD